MSSGMCPLSGCSLTYGASLKLSDTAKGRVASQDRYFEWADHAIFTAVMVIPPSIYRVCPVMKLVRSFIR